MIESVLKTTTESSMSFKLTSLQALRDRFQFESSSSSRRVISGYLPRFCSPKTLFQGRLVHGSGNGEQQTDTLPPTAYLDALRGYAAWIVFLAHGWDEFHFSVTRQPILSVVVAAKSMVALFFVISGYVLSYRLLGLAHRHHRNQHNHHDHHDHEKLLTSLASSTFRRGMRLWGSTIFALAIAGVLVCLGWDGGYSDDRLGKNTLWEQIGDWFGRLIWFMNPFVEVDGYFWAGTLQNEYLGPMWTIPVEIRGSMVLFLFLLATCMMGYRKRAALTWLAVGACYFWTKLYVAQFLMGMAVADFSLSREQDQGQQHSPRRSGGYVQLRMPSNSSTSTTDTTGPCPLHEASDDSFTTATHPSQSHRSKILSIAMLVAGLILLGQPNSGGDNLGILGDFPWKFLHSLPPSQYADNRGAHDYFYLGIGGFLLVLALDTYPVLRTPLNTPFSQYVGDLSFGIYAMHPIILIMVLRQWYNPRVRVQLFGDGFWGHVPGMILAHVLVFACADYFSRVDKRVVAVARRVSTWFFK
ncbi:uncharacterized protein PV06_10223 [Exophiala oligosperma]|uniref:Acyltransferase 3 domain-containing protein n=1 Tax=Exophiala oligosperma TaxID=215243 RepID=A0A0D2BJL1_9EURO|nr:uncharacterized protein PV06_10223 [Exophiala oligosperma]KIW37577.1 hypothetical protein PV06_10223 [Exophiala oligosperma]